MIGHIFRIGRARDAGWQIERGDLDAEAMARLEHIGGGHDLDLIFLHHARRHFALRFARQRMPRAARFGTRSVDRPMRGFQPAA